MKLLKEQEVRMLQRRYIYNTETIGEVAEHAEELKKDGFYRTDVSNTEDGMTVLYTKKQPAEEN
jgi:hypothetical protein